jgi:Ca2+-binding RTX toxin-like protein
VHWPFVAVRSSHSRLLAIGLLTVLSSFWPGPSPTLAGEPKTLTCTYSGKTVTITFPLGGGTATIIRKGIQIFVEDNPCTSATGKTATVDNTLDVTAIGSSNKDLFVVDIGQGPFFNADAQKRIHLSARLGAGYDTVGVRGSTKRDVIVLGGKGINLDARLGAAIDVSLNDVQRLFVLGLRGKDKIVAKGGSGTGGGVALRSRTTIRGGQGRDLIIGRGHTRRFARQEVVINGTNGPDKLYGGLNDDTIHGLAGNDLLVGGPGDDTLDGGADTDRCYGGAGDDTAPNCEFRKSAKP